MTKVTMPDPVAYLSCCPETGRPEWSESCVCEDAVFTVEETGTISRAVVFQDDLEAYANDRVREALEEAIIEVMRCKTSGIIRNDTVDKCADAIRALIPKEPPCET